MIRHLITLCLEIGKPGFCHTVYMTDWHHTRQHAFIIFKHIIARRVYARVVTEIRVAKQSWFITGLAGLKGQISMAPI